MQPNNAPHQDWQQPVQQGSQPPIAPVYSQETVATELDAPQPTEQSNISESPLQTVTPVENTPPQESETPAIHNSEDVQERDDAVVAWQAHESIEQSRPIGWYLLFIIVALGLLALSIFVFKSITFSLLIPVMAVAIFLYTRHVPEIISYTVSHKGVHVNDRLYSYDAFRSFNVIQYKQRNWLTLVPRKRFAMPVTAYFPEEVGEPLVDMLAARLPMKESKPDLLEKLINLLRL